jgi:hypothetical protein
MLTVLLLAFFYPSPTDDARASCAKLIESLNHQRFAVRETAARDVARLGSAAKPVLMLAIAKHRDPETVARCKTILKTITAAEVESLCPMPEIDTIWYCVERKAYDYQDKHKRFSAYLDAIGRDGPPWIKYRHATWTWAEEQLSNGVNVQALRVIIATMHARDEVFFREATSLNEQQKNDNIVDWKTYLRGR